MLSRKLVILSGVACLLHLPLLAEPAGADEPAKAVKTTPVVLNATVQTGEMVGFEQFRRVFMNVGDRRLMFVVPQGEFRVDTTDSEKVVLVNRDYTVCLSFRITTPEVRSDYLLSADTCRTWLSGQLGNPTVLDEFSLRAANCDGPAFDVISKTDGVTRSSRLAFIASPIGILEFTISTSPGKFSTAKSTLQGWLRGFQMSDANGPLKVTQFVQGGS